MKLLKKNYKLILGIIIGIILGTTSVYAASLLSTKDITFNNSGTTFNSTDLDGAMKEINTEANKKICTLKSGSAYAIGSKYECNPSLDGTTKYNFYVLRTDGNTVKLIMERNITDTLLINNTRAVTWGVAMNFFRNGAGKNLGWKVMAELPRAHDIADAVGNTSWEIRDGVATTWFCLASKTQDYSAEPLCGNGSSKNYLFDYTAGCSSWGCSHSLDSNYTTGYWTGDAAVNSTSSLLYVSNHGSVSIIEKNDSSMLGIRPVIVISKKYI